MLRRHYTRRVPLNANSRFHFAARRQKFRLHPNRLHLTVSLEFHRDFVAFASNHIPAHAVVHPEKAPDWFAINREDSIAGFQTSLLGWRVGHDITDHSR